MKMVGKWFKEATNKIFTSSVGSIKEAFVWVEIGFMEWDHSKVNRLIEVVRYRDI